MWGSGRRQEDCRRPERLWSAGPGSRVRRGCEVRSAGSWGAWGETAVRKRGRRRRHRCRPDAVRSAGRHDGRARRLPGRRSSSAASTNPTAVRFSPDGRVFVAEKSGLIKVFDEPRRHRRRPCSPTCAPKVHNYWDRGLLGLALDPSFPARPVRLRALHLRRADRRDAPRWGTPGTTDTCPTPPGPTTDGCVVSGRLSRLQRSGNVMTGTEQVLIDGLVPAVPEPLDRRPRVRRRRRALRQRRRRRELQHRRLRPVRQRPLNPCGDPPGGVGGDADAADRRGRRAAQPGPAHDRATRPRSTARSCASTRPPARRCPTTRSRRAPTRTRARIIAYGLRNPFRFTIRPGTNELWVGDVGWNTLGGDRPDRRTRSAPAQNFGWPCYEGSGTPGPLRRRRT